MDLRKKNRSPEEEPISGKRTDLRKRMQWGAFGRGSPNRCHCRSGITRQRFKAVGEAADLPHSLKKTADRVMV